MDNEISLMSMVGEWVPVLMRGAVVTLKIAFGSFAIGLAIGVLVALAKLKGNKPARYLANAYITVCRAVPELLLIILLFYAGNDFLNAILKLMNQDAVNLDGFWVAILTLGCVQGAYAAEIIRGAIQAIPFGHIEAAKSFGCGNGLVFRRIVIPEMVPFALAGLANLWIILIKDTALVSIVGYNELLAVTKQAAGLTRQYLLFYLVIALIYLVFTLISTYAFSRIERRYKRWIPSH